MPDGRPVPANQRNRRLLKIARRGSCEPPCQRRSWFWIFLAVCVAVLAVLYWLWTWERLEVFKMLLTSFFPLALLILAVLGSIVFGLATPTEAAAVGALGGCVLAAVYRFISEHWRGGRPAKRPVGEVLSGQRPKSSAASSRNRRSSPRRRARWCAGCSSARRYSRRRSRCSAARSSSKNGCCR